MRGTISAAVLAAIAATGCATDEMPDDYGEIEVAVTGDTVAAAYRVVIADATGKLLLERTIDPNQAIGPTDSRFVAALPADVLLLVQVFALDAANAELGAGATLVRLTPAQKTAVAIDVVAYQTGGSAGILDASISEAALPTREYLYPDPADAKPGTAQAAVARLTDAKTQLPVTTVVPLGAAGIIAPMYFPQNDGSLVAQWTWDVPQVYPASASIDLAYLDATGRGWIARVSTEFEDDLLAPVDFGWIGQVQAAGIVMPVDGQWLIGIVGPSHLRFQADANGDGDFADAGETASFPLPANTRPIVFTTSSPTQVVMPIDIAGAIFDQSGDGTLDTIATVGADGTLASAPWPLK